MAVLYLIRHAIAAERGPKYPKDDARPLTKQGIRRMKEVVAGWRTLDPAIELILTSPMVRAQSTADIIRRVLDEDIPLERTQALAPGHPPDDVVVALGKAKKATVIALVGHEPDLGQLAAWLLGAKEPLQFKKGGIARIDTPGLPPKQNGRLAWLATPRMLRALR